MRALVDAMEPVALSIMIGISEDGFRAQAVNSSNSWIADGQLESKIFDKSFRSKPSASMSATHGV